jgi:hypothetical protein
MGVPQPIAPNPDEDAAPGDFCTPLLVLATRFLLQHKFYPPSDSERTGQINFKKNIDMIIIMKINPSAYLVKSVESDMSHDSVSSMEDTIDA